MCAGGDQVTDGPADRAVDADDARWKVVLLDVDTDEQALIAIPLGWALAELTTYSALQHAATFGHAKSDAAAAVLIESSLPVYLERRYEQGEDDPRVKDDDPWDAEDFFGVEEWRLWRPRARETTADFLLGIGGQVAALLRPDDGSGWDYDPQPFVHVHDRQRLEGVLATCGYEVRQWRGLALGYLDAPRDAAAFLGLNVV